MSLGISSKLNVLTQSPHDLKPGCGSDRATAPDPRTHRWVPSRYNIRAKADDGRVVLWNTLSGSMNVFEPEKVGQILPMLKKAGVEGKEEGLIGYMVDRGYLVREGANEYRQLQVKFGQQHYRTDMLQLILMSSEDCNFRCKYCYEKFARGTMEPWVRTGVKNLIESRLGSVRHLHVNWFGGEPLYGWDAIADIAPFAHDLCREHGLNHYSHMTTNGYLLTPERVDDLFAWNTRNFQITMDGVPENHDCNRPTREGGGTFWTIFENLKAMAQRDDHFSVRLRVNFDRTNVGGLEEFLDLVAAEFRDDPRYKLDFHAVGQWGGENDSELEVCGADEQAKVMNDLKEAAYQRGLEIPTLREGNVFGGQVCYAARPYNLLIGATGKVMKCTILLDTDERNVVGQLHENGRLDIRDEQFALWTEPAFEGDSQCQKCVVLPACQGIHCPLVRIQDNTQPCCSTRSNPKGQLLEVLHRRPGRKVTVAAAPGN